MKPRFWAGKRVLITGFDGFLGSNLTRRLISCGARITGLDIKVDHKASVLTPGDYKKIRVIKGNVANYSLLRKIMKDQRIQVVFHLAAESLVGKGYSAPLTTFRSNICGTWTILEACRAAAGLESVIIASSDKAYGSHKNLPYKENYALIGDHPYDVSKSCADLVANTYFHTYGLPVAITRCGNIYGPGDLNFSRLVPDAMRCLIKDRTLKVRSDGTFVRDYVFVDDVVSGYLEIAELFKARKLSGEAFNLSAEKPMSVIRVLETMNALRLLGRKVKFKILNTAKYEIKGQYLCSAKARRVLGWKPKYSMAEGLKKTLGYYLEHFGVSS